MSAQYPISNQNQQVNNQEQEPDITVLEQQGQDLNDGSPDHSGPDVVDHYFDLHNGSHVIVRSLDPDQESVVDTTRRRPSLFRRGPFVPTFLRRTSTKSSLSEIVEDDAQVPERAEATESPPSPSQRKRRTSSVLRAIKLLFSKDNNVIEAVEEAEIPRAQHVEHASEHVKALYEEQEQARNATLKPMFSKRLPETMSKL